VTKRSSLLLILSSVALAAVSGVGCGYALAGRGSFLPDYIKTIGIPMFVNRTTVFNVETLLTEKVRSEFIGRGKYTVLPEAAGVDALLTGEVTGISVTPVSFTDQQQASRYVITMTVKIELRDVREGRMMWENPSLSFRQEYEPASGTSALDPAAFFGQEANALERVSTDFARTIVSSILEAF
jgi:hypothetical protein